MQWMPKSVQMARSVTMQGVLLLAVLSCLLGMAASGYAQSDAPSRRDRVYLTQLAFVLEGARRVVVFGEAHSGDTELSRFIYPLAEHYVEMAGRMTPGERLKIVHPHLLLVVENVERAFSAAREGDHHAFRQHVRTIREELSTLDAVLRHLKVRLPEPVR